jgi:hypothetical protein
VDGYDGRAVQRDQNAVLSFSELEPFVHKLERSEKLHV